MSSSTPQLDLAKERNKARHQKLRQNSAKCSAKVIANRINRNQKLTEFIHTILFPFSQAILSIARNEQLLHHPSYDQSLLSNVVSDWSVKLAHLDSKKSRFAISVFNGNVYFSLSTPNLRAHYGELAKSLFELIFMKKQQGGVNRHNVAFLSCWEVHVSAMNIFSRHYDQLLANSAFFELLGDCAKFQNLSVGHELVSTELGDYHVVKPTRAKRYLTEAERIDRRDRRAQLKEVASALSSSLEVA